MFHKILGFSTTIILAGCLIEGNHYPSFASNLNNNRSESYNSYQIARGRTHRVRLGDTLGGIANRFGISVNQLLNYNPQLRSRPNLIYVGETINLGGSSISRTPTPASQSSGRKYTVRSGDTLGGIAIRHGLSLRTILAYNPHLASRPNSINVGEKINVGSAQIIRRTSRNKTISATTTSQQTVSSSGSNNQPTSTTPTSTSSPQTRRQSVFNNLTTERRPGSNNTGSKRGPGTACTQAGKNMRAIAPDNGLGFTFDDYPYFFWYFPGVEYARGIDFMLFKQTIREDNGELEHTRVYRQKLNLNKSGIIAFPLPAEKSPPLEEGQEYRWRIRIQCTGNTAMNLSYSIERQSTDNTELISKLEAAPVDQHPVIFADSGVWFDALKMITLQLEQAPGDPILTEDWNNVLRRIGFEDLIGEPIYIEPNSQS